ncbi:MAG: hypothetical protein WC358_06995 [Ignavibacteria bacterium]|jgi:hypothetical protein
MALIQDFTFASIIAAINTEIHKTDISRGMITVNLQFEQVDPVIEGADRIVGAYNMSVKPYDAPLGDAKKDGIIHAAYDEEVAPD